MTYRASDPLPTLDTPTIRRATARGVRHGGDASMAWGPTMQGTKSSAVARLSAAALVGDRYRPVRLLAAGGAGSVYEAEHVHTGGRVALKVMEDQGASNALLEARFRAEARIASSIDSEHVVSVIDAGAVDAHDSRRFLVMELLRGRTLEHEASAPMDPSDVIDILGQVADGVQKAHARGVVHCDLKPENIFVVRRDDDSRLIKVLDFGIAKQISRCATMEQHAIMGTPHYMSPEQARGERADLDERTDTWALGLIAFRLLAGKPYFSGSDLARVLSSVIFEPLRRPSEMGCPISAAFDAWFLRSCSRDLSERFRSPTEQIGALADALAPLVRGPAAAERCATSVARGTSKSARHTMQRRERSGARRQPLFAGLLAAAVLLGWSLPPRSSGQPLARPESERASAFVRTPPESEPIVEPWNGTASGTRTQGEGELTARVPQGRHR